MISRVEGPNVGLACKIQGEMSRNQHLSKCRTNARAHPKKEHISIVSHDVVDATEVESKPQRMHSDP